MPANMFIHFSLLDTRLGRCKLKQYNCRAIKMSKRCESKLKKWNSADKADFLESTSVTYFIICYYTILWNAGVSILLFIYKFYT